MEQPVEKTEKIQAPSVAVDGAKVRSVRETKKLTQLYLASVVGVTTDTISRWENNRYPSIKRDNAEKLAGALEVDLAEILRQEEPGAQPETVTARSPLSSARLWLLSGFAALLLVIAAVYSFLQWGTPTPSAIRWVPRFAAPGEIVPVQIKVTRQRGENTGVILKERMPPGVLFVRSLPPYSAFDSTSRSVKWLIPSGNASVTVSYTVEIPAGAAAGGELKFDGEIVVRSSRVNRTDSISGSDRIRIGAYHWADSNGDGRIDDDEIMPAYYVCEEMKGLDLDWKTIEAIWSGKGYRWDPQRGFEVIK